MKKRTAIALAVLIFLNFGGVKAQAAMPEKIISEGAILMDADTGQVLYAKNEQQKMFPASTTKIMTALICAEKTKPSQMMTASPKALDISEPGSSNIALKEGEMISSQDALLALMLRSANDVANVIAEGVAGSEEEFAKLMTQRALEIGAKDTNFKNAHGLHDPEHYTTVYDMALITKEAIKNSRFLQYFGAASYTMLPTNKTPSNRAFTNYQLMLIPESNYYNQAVIGGKVGYTTAAQHTMSTVAKKNGRTLICVVFHSYNKYDKFNDTKTLLDYGFNSLTSYKISKTEIKGFAVPLIQNQNTVGEVLFECEDDVTVLLPSEIIPPKLSVEYSKPDYLEVGNDYKASAVIVCDNMPQNRAGEIGRIYLEGRVNIFSVDDAALAEAAKPTALQSFLRAEPFGYRKLLFLLLPFGVIIFLRYLKRKKEESKRQKRREVLRQQRLEREESEEKARTEKKRRYPPASTQPKM